MELSTANYKKQLSPDLIKKAAKCTVRECDEVGPRQFQAYVDENKESFDVNITLNNKDVLTSHNCDCTVKAIFCQHKIALLLFAKGDKKEKRSPARSKKSDQVDIVLNEINTDELKIWIKELLGKNKDLELSFLNQFSNQQKKYGPDDVKRLTLEAVKAVINNRKKAETAEVKRIVDLWTEIHRPIVDWYCTDLADESAFLGFDAIMKAGEEVRAKINMSGSRLGKYLESQLSRVTIALNALEKNEVWKTALTYFVNLINNDVKRTRVDYLPLLAETLDVTESKAEQQLIDQLMQGFITTDPEIRDNAHAYIVSLFTIVAKGGLFGKYYQYFQPITFNNQYNEVLITLLIHDGHLRLAEKYCKQQIESNYREEYDVLYLQLLKHIYTVEKNDKELAKVLLDLFPITYNFDDYLFILDRLKNEEEKKKWRSKILSRARHTTNNPNALSFVFKLADAEKNYKKMIEYINEYAWYSLILEYAAKMIAADKKLFLSAVLNKRDNLHTMDEEDAIDSVPLLFEILVKYYDMNEIKSAKNEVTSSWRFSTNLLITYIEEAQKVKRTSK